MTDLEARPDERPVPGEPLGAGGTPRRQVLPARTVPLGGVRGLEVRRTLPQRDVPTVGAWCFVDRYGPTSASMRVLPHPHTGLATVTWPLSGPVRHRDSVGSDVVVRPGELDLMTAGRGVSHSEVSLDDGAPLSGVQLWLALPDATRHDPPRFEHHRDLPVLEGPRSSARVMVGRLGDAVSPARTDTRAVAAEVTLAEGATTLPLDPRDEHALLVLTGDPAALAVDGGPVPEHALLHLGAGREGLDLLVAPGAGAVRVLLLGGEPFREDLLMWWNLVARTHDEVVAWRDDWEARSDRYGRVDGHGDERIPAPPLPGVRLVPRRRAS